MHLSNVMGRLCASSGNHEQKKLLRVMRLTGILLLAASMQLSATGFSQQVTLSVKNASLDKVFTEIRKQTGYEFFYNTSMLQKAKKVNLDVKNETINRVLDLCFSNQPFDYVVYEKTIVVKQKEVGVTSIPTEPNLPADQRVSGRVVDENGQALQGATVSIQGKNGGVTTDANGRFEIMVPNLKVTLLISYVGYSKQEVLLNGRTDLDVSLKSETSAMSNLVVVGYGTVRKKDITGAVSTVKFNEKEAAQITSVDKLLQGRAAGVEVNTGSAAPGGAVNVRIRGLSSISGGTEPLYVVDGVIVSTATQDNTNALKVGTNPGNSYQEAQNGLTAINPQDIESIEILKDASATAIYGSRGANGVVLITTKQGKAGKGIVAFSSSLEFARVSKKMPMLDGLEYANFRNQTRPTGPFYNLTTIQPIDWQDDIFETGVSSNNRITLSGKNEKSNYYLAFGYLNNNGVIPTTGFKQGDLRFNFTQDVTSRLRIGSRTSLFYRRNSMTQSTEQLGSASQSIIRQILAKEPILDTVGSTVNIDEGIEGPRAWLKEYDDITKEFRVLQSLSLDYKLSNAFSVRTLGGGDIRYKDRRRWFGKDLSQGKLTNGQLGVSSLKSYAYNLEAMLLFNKVNGRHRFNGTAGMTYDYSNVQNAYTVNEDFFTEDLRIYGMGTGAKVYPQFEDFTNASILSALARMVYSFNDKYIVTATGRYDGTSRFAEGNKWGFFPSLAVAWRASDEDFIKNLNIFSTLKPRFGYGLTGNQAINPYSTIARYKAAYYSTGNGSTTVGAVPAVLANPNLTWESSAQANLGLDAGILADKVTFSVDIYHKKTKDLLQNFKIPISTGFTTIAANKGSIENKGLEFSLQAIVVDKKIKWNVGGNISFNRNKIVDIGQPEGQFGANTLKAFYGVNVAGGTEFASPANIFAEGYPVGMFYGFQTRGIYKPEDLARDPLKYYGVALQPGDIYFIDKNGDGNITDLDKDFIGNPNPKFVYGFTSSLSYKQLSLNIFMNGVYGNQIANGNVLKMENTSLGTNITKSAYYDAWSSTNTGGTKPRLLYVNKDFTDMIVEDGSYFRFAMVTLSYRLPVRASWLSALDVYVTGRNLLTISKYTGFDPEVNSFTYDPMRTGVDWSSYPNTRAVVFGLNATF
jgi:TonB-dependent starch-binding outer membrane protein SusC